MRHETPDTYTCDVCDASMAEWQRRFHLTVEGALTRGDDPGGYDICSPGCLREWVERTVAAVSDLVAFLEERLAEDESVARAAVWDKNDDDGVWSVSPYSHENCRVEGIGITIYDEGGHSPEQAQHIARHDPARVLREVEAKRWIVWLLTNAAEQWGRGPITWKRLADANRDVLRYLAAVYSDHPSYREEWQP